MADLPILPPICHGRKSPRGAIRASSLTSFLLLPFSGSEFGKLESQFFGLPVPGGVAVGDLTPAEASELGKLIEAYIKALEATDFAERLTKLERMTNR
jgi:hypothetical protein